MAIIEMIKNKPTTFKRMRDVINYINNLEKTNIELMGGHNCINDFAYEEFTATKNKFKKFDGIQCIHFVQSFKPGECNAETAKQIADELVKFKQFRKFQIVYAVHCDKEHIHTHFVINSVGLNGKKWHQNKRDLQRLKDYSDEICRSFDLSVCEKKHSGHRSPMEYRKGRLSYKYELYLAALNAKNKSVSFEDFEEKLKMLGYKIEYGENRKYITFVTPENKKIRNRSLYPAELFTYKALLKRFEENRINFSDRDIESGRKFFEYIQKISEREKLPLSYIIETETEYKVSGEKKDEYLKLNKDKLLVDETASLRYYIPQTLTFAYSKEKFIELFKKLDFDVEFKENEIIFTSGITGNVIKNTDLKDKEQKSEEKFSVDEILKNIERSAFKREVAYSVLLTAKHSLSFNDFTAKLKELSGINVIIDNKEIKFKKCGEEIKNTELFKPENFEYEKLKTRFEKNKQKGAAHSVWKLIVEIARAGKAETYPVSTNSVLCGDASIKDYKYRFEESESLYNKNRSGYIANKESEERGQEI